MGSVNCAIFCDEIRQEVNGKLILIGAYTESMIVPRFPWTSSLATLIRFGSDTRMGDLHRFMVRAKGGATFGEMHFVADREGANDLAGMDFWVAMPPVQVSLSGPDTIELWVGDQIVSTLPVSLGVVPTHSYSTAN